MRTLILSLLLVMCAGTVVSAQTAEHSGNYNLFTGYSYLNAELQTDSFNFNGAGANFAAYPWTNTALVADFSVNFRDNSWILYVLGGPRHEFPGHTASVFIEGLAGLSYLNPELGESDSNFIYGGGGGIDWKFWNHTNLRIPQIDILYGRNNGNGFVDYRVQFGTTFPF